MRTQGFQYYTRVDMWTHAAKYAHVQNLDDLTSEEFEACLAEVDQYYHRYPARRFDWQIQKSKGPESVGERHMEKAAYNANVQKFRFYQRRVFEKYLESLNEGVPLSPPAATERQFMDA